MITIIIIYYNYAIHIKYTGSLNARAIKETRDLSCQFFLSYSFLFTVLIFTLLFSEEP